MMKMRLISALLAAMLLLGALTGCAPQPGVTEEGGTAATHQTTEAVTLPDLQTLYDQGMEALSKMGDEAPVLFPESNIQYLNEFYPGLADVAMRQFCAGVAPVTNAPFEVLLVEVADKADVQTVLNIFQARADRESADTTYPENAKAWMNNCKITSRGCYVFLAVLMDPCVVPAEFILD